MTKTVVEINKIADGLKDRIRTRAKTGLKKDFYQRELKELETYIGDLKEYMYYDKIIILNILYDVRSLCDTFSL